MNTDIGSGCDGRAHGAETRARKRSGGHFPCSSFQKNRHDIGAAGSGRPIQKGRKAERNRKTESKPSENETPRPPKKDRETYQKSIHTPDRRPSEQSRKPHIQKTSSPEERRCASCTLLRNSAENGGIPRESWFVRGFRPISLQPWGWSAWSRHEGNGKNAGMPRVR